MPPLLGVAHVPEGMALPGCGVPPLLGVAHVPEGMALPGCFAALVGYGAIAGAWRLGLFLQRAPRYDVLLPYRGAFPFPYHRLMVIFFATHSLSCCSRWMVPVTVPATSPAAVFSLTVKL